MEMYLKRAIRKVKNTIRENFWSGSTASYHETVGPKKTKPKVPSKLVLSASK
jgi:hypothetical protein